MLELTTATTVTLAQKAAPEDLLRAALLALERVTHSYRMLLSGKPVRDVRETLAEADAALAARIAALESPAVALSKRDADYWMESRAAIITALDEAGFLLTSDASGFKVVKAPGSQKVAGAEPPGCPTPGACSCLPSQDREAVAWQMRPRNSFGRERYWADSSRAEYEDSSLDAVFEKRALGVIAARQAPKEQTK